MITVRWALHAAGGYVAWGRDWAVWTLVFFWPRTLDFGMWLCSKLPIKWIFEKVPWFAILADHKFLPGCNLFTVAMWGLLLSRGLPSSWHYFSTCFFLFVIASNIVGLLGASAGFPNFTFTFSQKASSFPFLTLKINVLPWPTNLTYLVLCSRWTYPCWRS